MPAREALEVATRGGAEVLGRDDLGAIVAGKRADFVLWDTTGIEMAGAWDPVGGLLLSGPQRPRDVWVEGKQIVRNGQLTTLDTSALSQKAAVAINRLIETQ